MAPLIESVELSMADLEALLARLKGQVGADDLDLVEKLVGSYAYLTDLVAQDRTTIADLRKLLHGKTKKKTTEKTEDVVGSQAGDAPASSPGAATASAARKTRKGHGRHGAQAYPAAQRVPIAHGSLSPGAACPTSGCAGVVYVQNKPAVLIRITGQAPLAATVFELERLRCNLCGTVFTAEPPAGVGERKYDAKSAAMIALLKYGSGLPFNRLAGLQKALRIPLPASTQWEVVRDAAASVRPVFDELLRQAAQGEVLHNDDTSVTILELMGRRAKAHPEMLEEASSEDGVPKDRTGLFTSGVVSTRAGKKIALFFSGRRHAGENLSEVLRHRAAELARPLQMCDALTRNLPKELEVVVANCLAHCRRYFVEEAGSFPDECRHVLEELAIVYRNDALARERELTAEDRLQLHRAESEPVMTRLHGWMTAQFEERRVEPNSGLGKAIRYALNHWEKLSRFLHEPGAPLDNNICERALKKAILHRKNAMFYKTRNGAAVGDLFMSLIHTCQLAGVNPFDYLAGLVEHADALAGHPHDWMPWSFRSTIEAAAR